MAMLMLVVAGSVWLLVNWFSAPRGGDVPPASESSADFIGAVELGGVDLPVTGVIGTHGSGGTVYAGAVHDEPRFDTGKLGVELPFLSTDRRPIPAEVPGGEVVYVGTVSDRSIYLYEGTVVDGAAPGQLCVASTAGIAGCKSPGAQLTEGAGEVWLTGLGPEATAVMLRIEGAPAVWQRPVAGTVWLVFDTPGNADLAFEVYDLNGAVVSEVDIDQSGRGQFDVAGIGILVDPRNSVLTAERGPGARFEVEAFGAVERTLQPSSSGVTIPRRAVYLGDLVELSEPVFIIEGEGPSGPEICVGVGPKGDATTACAPTDSLPVKLSLSRPGSEASGGSVQAIVGLKAGIAVVVLEVDGVPVSWQEVIGGSAVFEVPPGGGTNATAVGYDMGGTEVARFDLPIESTDQGS
jgi:hypothetical protein